MVQHFVQKCYPYTYGGVHRETVRVRARMAAVWPYGAPIDRPSSDDALAKAAVQRLLQHPANPRRGLGAHLLVILRFMANGVAAGHAVEKRRRSRARLDPAGSRANLHCYQPRHTRRRLGRGVRHQQPWRGRGRSSASWMAARSSARTAKCWILERCPATGRAGLMASTPRARSSASRSRRTAHRAHSSGGGRDGGGGTLPGTSRARPEGSTPRPRSSANRWQPTECRALFSGRTAQ
jgi:hypothetical protein